MPKDYYDILGVKKDAGQDEIKNAFRKKAHEFHPDKGGNAEKFKEINEAYQILGNPEKRQQYDQFGAAAFSGGQGGFNWGGFSPGQGFSGFQNAGFNFDFEDLGDIFGGLGDMFGFSSGRRTKKSRAGHDLEMDLNISFREAVFGAEKEINFTKNVICPRCRGNGAEPGAKIETCKTCGGSGRVSRIQRTILGNIQTQLICPHCHGEGKIFSQRCSQCLGTGIVREPVKIKVRIPAGVDDGESIHLRGQGEAGQNAAPAGDLYLRLGVGRDRKFIRDGYDLKTEETISVKQAALGDKIEIETVYGLVKLKIPEGTQSGTIFRLKGKGIARLHNRGTGDQLVKVKVKIPSGLSKKQKQILEELDL